MGGLSLKEQNQQIVHRYIWAVVGTYFFVIGASNFSELNLFVENFGKVENSWRLIIPIISAGLYIFLIRLVPTEVKEVLVFWRVKERLPGHRAFTEIAKNDVRISLDKLVGLHGTLPSNGMRQNELWYSIYRKHRDLNEVLDPHKSYLLYRELTYLNLAIGLLLLLPSLLVGLLSVKIGLLLIAMVTLASFALSLNAQNSAKRMVQNVLALESSGV